ncbi:MAG: hypothetical protein ACOH5I_21960 [Oligoflexus sp.]
MELFWSALLSLAFFALAIWMHFSQKRSRDHIEYLSERIDGHREWLETLDAAQPITQHLDLKVWSTLTPEEKERVRNSPYAKRVKALLDSIQEQEQIAEQWKREHDRGRQL